MKGYKTAVCVICGEIHDTAANCPSHQAICAVCQKKLEGKVKK